MKNMTLLTENFKYKLLLDQSDMYNHILSKFSENIIEPKMITWVLLEYIRYVINIIYNDIIYKSSYFILSNCK